MTTKPTTNIDIASITMNDTMEHELFHPVNGDKLGLVFTLRSMEHHPEMKKITRRISDKALKLRARSKNLTAEEIEQNTVELISTAVEGWRWLPGASFNGKTPEYSPKALAELFAMKWPVAQLDEALGDTSRFFEK